MKQAKRQEYLVERIQNFTRRVIETKRKEFEAKNEVNHNNAVDAADDEEEFGVKKRLALLDLLLNAKQEGQALTDDDIQEEVNNFMFAVSFLKITSNVFGFTSLDNVTGSRYDNLLHRVLTVQSGTLP